MSKKLVLILLAGLLAVGTAVVVACDNESDGDADSDVDVDADADGDGDGDGDSDADPCGDGTCAGTETVRSCPADCPAVCGDGECSHDETEASCAEDCAEGCDIIALTDFGCAANEKCSPYSTDEGVSLDVGCVPLNEVDAVGPGEVCAILSDTYFGTFDNCTQGYTCLYSAEQVCERFCSRDDRTTCTDAYPDPESGELTADGVCFYSLPLTDIVPGIMLCDRPASCDPFCQDCEDRAAACLPSTDGNFYCTDVSRESTLPGDGITGDECSAYINSCLPGYMCLDTVCRPICNPTYVPPAGDGDADADADVDAGGDADADADADADVDAGDGGGPDPLCPFTTCAQHLAEGANDECVGFSDLEGIGACSLASGG